MDLSLEEKSIVILPSWYPTEKDPISGIFIQQQAQALQATGLNISIFFVAENWWPTRDFIHCVVEEGLPTYRNNAFVPPKRIKWLRFYWYGKWERLLEKYIAERGSLPQLLHAHSFVAGAAARFLGKKYGIPYLITEHYDGFISGKLPSHWRRELAGIYGDAAKVIAVSSSLERAMASYCRKVEVIPNMIDTEIFRPDNSTLNRSGLNKLISVGSLVPRKDFATILRILAGIRQEIPAELVIVGNGPLRNALRQLAKELGIDHAVHFKGILSPVALAQEMQEAHLFVSASRSESFALAPLEALACGLPVVMRKCGSIVEELATEQIEVVTTEEGLKSGILRYLKCFYTTDRQSLFDRIRDEFGPDRVAAKLKAVYADLL